MVTDIKRDKKEFDVKECKYTFNSFKYMKDFDVKDFNKIDSHPFRIASILETLLMGAMNSNPKEFVQVEDVQDYLEEYAVEGDLSELLNMLMAKLEESNFFKSLQKKK